MDRIPEDLPYCIEGETQVGEDFYLRYGTIELRTVLGNLNRIGIANLRKSQEVIISNHVRGNDLEITGGAAQGRTTAVLVSLVAVVGELVNASDVEGPHALYIAPTHEQTTKAFEIISILARAIGLGVCCLTTTNTNTEDADFVSLRDYNIVVSTPGLVLKMEGKSRFLSMVRYLVVDDAHMSVVGRGGAAVHTRNVLKTMQDDHHPDLVTTIISNERLGPFIRYLRSQTHVTLQILGTRAMLSLSYVPITGNRSETIQRIVSECCQNEKVVIFVARIKQGESLVSSLQGAGLSARITHNGKAMNERLMIIQEFNEGRCRVLITCRIGLSGISLQAVNSVILDRPPEGWDDFLAAVHKAGLVQDGKAYLILDRDNEPEVERFQAILANFHRIKDGAAASQVIKKSTQPTFGPSVATTRLIVRGFPWSKTCSQIMEMFPFEYRPLSIDLPTNSVRPDTESLTGVRRIYFQFHTAERAQQFKERYNVISLLERRVVLPSLNHIHSRTSQAYMSVLLSLDHILKTTVALVGRLIRVHRVPWGVILSVIRDELSRDGINKVRILLIRFIDIFS
ncbi:hypothetical protein CNMCM7927_003379 [Aspergillus lentulus]|nr:hypothetical protein CNMCM7927_003379 [Aspergillus lentulus]